MSLDISALHKAITRLQEGLVRYQQDITDTQIRDGLVQRFEFTYEISHKILIWIWCCVPTRRYRLSC